MLAPDCTLPVWDDEGLAEDGARDERMVRVVPVVEAAAAEAEAAEAEAEEAEAAAAVDDIAARTESANVVSKTRRFGERAGFGHT